MSPQLREEEPVDPSRVRRPPRHFAWVDHRLRDRLHSLSLEEIALLFFLHLAADRNGCSFFSDPTLARKLSLREGDVIEARHGLIRRGLVAYRFPLYQILPLEEDAS
jgi:hypothetical protein